MNPTGLIFDIKRFSVNDGPGIRTTVFLKGCPLTCWWCHNPESWSCDVEQVAVTRRFNGRNVHYQETVGKNVTVDDVMLEIDKEAVFHETSGGGVTFSGGEPLLQPEFLKGLAEACRARNIHTCLDTSGYCEPDLFNRLMANFDLFLYDLKILDRKKHIHFTGYPNDDILKNLRQLDQSGANYIIRVPFVPGVNDDKKSAGELMAFLQSLSNPVKEIHFLPYHAMARQKLKRMGLEDKMERLKKVNEPDLHKFVLDFQRAGYRVKIGG